MTTPTPTPSPEPTAGQVLYPDPAPGADTTPPSGNDTQTGSTEPGGNDTLTSDSGNDTLTSDTGNDTATGNDTTANDSAQGNDSVQADNNDSLTAASYDAIALPEGYTVNDAVMSKFKETALAAGVKPDQAQSLLNLYGEAAQAQLDAQLADFNQTQTTWKAEVANLPEFKTNKDAATATIGRVLDEFGDAQVKQIFDLTGAGNHPSVVKMLLAIGKQLGEGEPTPPGGPANKGGPKTAGQILYPDAQ
jgi:hypothetical protein